MKASAASPHTDHAARPALASWKRAAVWLVALLAMAGVFALYVQPDFMLLMADQVWACI